MCSTKEKLPRAKHTLYNPTQLFTISRESKFCLVISSRTTISRKVMLQEHVDMESRVAIYVTNSWILHKALKNFELMKEQNYFK